MNEERMNSRQRFFMVITMFVVSLAIVYKYE